MTAILVLATFVVFIAIDYFFRKKVAARRAASHEAKPLPTTVPGMALVGGFEVRPNFRYHPGHAWALGESPSLVRVGMDDFAARLLGKVDAISVPERGQWIRQGQPVITVTKGGSHAHLVSPIEGEVSGVNEVVAADASLAGRDPYGDGWLITVNAPDAQTNFRNLLRGSLARKWMEVDSTRLHKRMSAAAPTVAQDGGVALDNLGDQFPGPEWEKVTREFFLA